jgi:hypothetical protein
LGYTENSLRNRDHRPLKPLSFFERQLLFGNQSFSVQPHPYNIRLCMLLNASARFRGRLGATGEGGYRKARTPTPTHRRPSCVALSRSRPSARRASRFLTKAARRSNLSTLARQDYENRSGTNSAEFSRRHSHSLPNSNRHSRRHRTYIDFIGITSQHLTLWALPFPLPTQLTLTFF